MPADPFADLQRVYLEDDLARALGTGVDAVRARARTGKTLRGWNSQENPTNVWLYDADFADAHLPQVVAANLPHHFIAGLTAYRSPVQAHPIETLDLELALTNQALIAEREERLRTEVSAARTERDAARTLLDAAQGEVVRAREETARLRRALTALVATHSD